MSASVAIAFAGGAAVGAFAMKMHHAHKLVESLQDKVVSIERDIRGEKVIRISKATEEDLAMDKAE